MTKNCKVTSREELDNKPCQECGKPLKISGCAMDLGSDCCKAMLLTATYEGGGRLTLNCGKCGKFVVRFIVE